MSSFKKNWEDLSFSDNFIFCKVMRDENLCRQMIEILLGIKVDHIEYTSTEYPVESFYESKGIRMDVFVKGNDKVFDLEMQTGDYEDLILRSRYYQSSADVSSTPRRTKYRELKETYILFICKDDPFGAGLPCYTKKTSFLETEAVCYDDKTHNVFYNSSAFAKCQNEELRSVLEFIYNLKAHSKFTRELESSVNIAKAKPVFKDEYMYFIDILEEEKELAREEGLAEGREVGLAEGKAEGHAEGIIEGERANKIKNARNLLEMNVLSIEQIAKAVELPVEEVLKIN